MHFIVDNKMDIEMEGLILEIEVHVVIIPRCVLRLETLDRMKFNFLMILLKNCLCMCKIKRIINMNVKYGHFKKDFELVFDAFKNG